MNCKVLHEKLIFFLEGELPASEMAKIEVHLSECASCDAFAREMKKTLFVIDAEKSPAVNPYFYTRLKAKIENQEAEKEQVFWQPAFVRVLQPVLFSVLLLTGIYTGIKIGEPVVAEKYTVASSSSELIPFLNEMEVESLETSLME